MPDARSLRRTAIWLTIFGISIYLVFPSLLEVLGSAHRIGEFTPGWLAVMLGLQILSLGCLWELQRIAIPSASWFAVVTSQLAGNGLSKIAPGGGAVGGALQYKMLVQAGAPAASVAGAITAVNLLVFAVVLALPVLAIPTFLAGSVDDNLVKATLIGVGVFLAITVFGALFFSTNRPLAGLGRFIQRTRNRVLKKRDPLEGVPEGLLLERDRILATLGPRWKRALLASVGRWAFDYGSLLAALAALGSHPRPALVLLAFCAAQVLAQIPFTPGGLGFVEAGMTAMLSFAGVPAGTAVLATFAYRLFTYWLPLPAGLVAAILHRRRFSTPAEPTPA